MSTVNYKLLQEQLGTKAALRVNSHALEETMKESASDLHYIFIALDAEARESHATCSMNDELAVVILTDFLEQLKANIKNKKADPSHDESH